ncbi:helicase-exonuclease AddAB subunit AddB [Parageobacillus toebii]|nr:helicase-exonuclease AddAB subunit AddB [Parageobacillus yumthangensis]PUF88592.1 helicase-exonuclease AddAB subunit AddB [Geobacillus sp. LYN3]RDV20870.1 helicase-exonuclease AddAB subunit AddB [Parageobacillus toebii]TXK88760.1 helicase-exonuclease AddAB subunit AddB [Geobacillus sp. AYS3]
MKVISMSLRFLLGRSGSGKTTTCLNEIRRKLKEEPKGNPIIYLVPEQMTFQSEYALIHTPGLGGMIRAQVFSFTRLAWRILQETGGMSRYHVNDIGMQMMIRKIVEQKKQQLKLFGRAVDKTGFIKQLHDMITECKRYCVTPQHLREHVKALTEQRKKPAEKVLADKLNDISIIYEELERSLLNHYIDSEDYLRLLSEKIPQSRYLRNAEIYIDGFHQFTPQEYMVLEQLLIHCKRVTVALTVDAPYDDRLPNELHLFYLTAKTYHDIRQMALLNDVAIEETMILDRNMRHQEKALAHLEAYYHERPAVVYSEETEAVNVYEAANRRAEIEAIAREIVHLVRDKGYRYRDIALIVRNTEDYRDLVKTIFYDFHIPYFMDEKEPMHHHPLIELLRASMEIITSRWRYESVFRAIKTDLLFPVEEDIVALREAMDQLENYVLAYGIKGEKWTNGERWTYRRYQALEGLSIPQTDEEKQYEEKLNEWRDIIAAPLSKLERRMRRAKDGRSLCEAIYLFLEELQIPRKLEKMSKESEEQGRLMEARQHEQVWNAVIDLLNQYVEMLGDESIPVAEFAKIIETGLDRLEFSLVPPAMDQVIIAQLDRSRLIDVKCAFIIGVNEGIIPAKAKEDGLLAETERELLQQFGTRVAPGGREQLFYEPFFIYLALTSPSERLYVTYPLANEEGKALSPSIIIKHLTDLFPNLQKRVCGNDPLDAPFAEQHEFVTVPRATLTYLVTQLQAWKRNYSIAPLWWDVYNFYVSDQQWRSHARKAIAGVFYTNEATPLKKEISKRLYGKKIQASVSRMEQFQKCPFSHFVSHGLRLKERAVFRLDAPDIGQLFHSALKIISDRLREAKIDWRHLSKKQCEQLSMEAVEQIAPLIQQQILLSSNRYYYMKQKLQNVIARTTNVLSEHAKASSFVPIGLELEFGPNGVLPPLTFRLPDGTVMELVGRIDRVDKAESSRGVLLRVIDYKSSAKTLNLTEVYYGLALQMLTYLDIVLTYAEQLVGKEAFPAGILYFHVHNPIIKSDQLLYDEKEVERKLLEQFKMRGLLLGDVEAIRLMDTQMEEGKWSLIVPAQITKKGAIHSSSSVVSEEDFSRLRQHIRQLFQTIGIQIVDGIVDISPYKLNEQTPCEFCAFKSVCQFDESFSNNRYRLLVPEENREIVQKFSEGKD